MTMTRNLKFYKDHEGWFVDLPEWTGSKYDLQMVSGADTFLDIIAQGETETYLTLSDTPIENSNKLKFKEVGRLEGFELGEGAWYTLNQYIGIEYDLEMWLCDVTKFVFGNFPTVIYFI
jgi:uncharacterized ubiquitin-like protein YukD